jgi:hypothetical protein
VRLRRRSFRASIEVVSGPAPIVFHLGLVSFEASITEAHMLAVQLVDAIEQARSSD